MAAIASGQSGLWAAGVSLWRTFGHLLLTLTCGFLAVRAAFSILFKYSTSPLTLRQALARRRKALIRHENRQWHTGPGQCTIG